MFNDTIMQPHRFLMHAGRALLLAGLALSACTGRMERMEDHTDSMRSAKSHDTIPMAQPQTLPAAQDTAVTPVAIPAIDTVRTGFSGRWVWQGEEGASFELRLDQKDTVLTGFHCAITANARRVDCASNDDSKHSTPTITGTVNGRSATITFRSIYGIDKKGNRVTGTARIIHRGDSIEWRIEGQATGEHWLPFAVTLKPV